MPDDVTLRDFRDEDFTALGELWTATGVGNPARGDTLENIKRTLAAGGRLTLLVKDGRIAGSVWVTDDARRLYVHHMAVAPDLQGRGLSKPLLESAVRTAKERNLQMKLEVHRDNVRAIALYKKYGFDFIGDYEVMLKRGIG
jgi:[ribosomal protein S18]-alanine N-acetyltransferase